MRTLPCHWPEQGGLDGFFIARTAAKLSAGSALFPKAGQAVT